MDMIRWRGRKRCRDFREKSRSKRHFSESICPLCFIVWIVLLQSTFAKQFYYTSCFNHIRGADDNGDRFLSREEYTKFLITISGGAVLLQNETPPVLSDPYTKRMTSGTFDIHGIDVSSFSTTTDQIGVVETFCKDVYTGLLSIFDIKIVMDQCLAAFKTADVNPHSDSLSSNEYTFFVVNLTKDVSLVNSSFNELSNTIQDAFNDMKIDGEIKAQQGVDYLLDFCGRVAIAVEIGEVVYASMPTKAPVTNAPAFPPIRTPSVSPSETVSECRTALVASDQNRNLWLDSSEYGVFLTRLSNDTIPASDFASLDKIFQDTYNGLIAIGDVFNISGYSPELSPTQLEFERLTRLCNETKKAIAIYELELSRSPSPNAPSNSPTIPSNSTTISEDEFQACKTSMVLSDLNRNNVLEDTEFIRFISRMTTNTDLTGYSFNDLDIFLQDIFRETASNTTGGINVDGSKPGQDSTSEQENGLRTLCTGVLDAILDLEINGPMTRAPTDQSGPSAAPSTDEIQMPGEFFSICKKAMIIADLNRDDSIEKEEYVRFLNRLTISEFSGDAFDDLEPVLRDGFFAVAVENKIDVYGSKPGVTPTEQQLLHLQDVCESVYIAIKDHNGRQATEPPIAVPPNDCASLLFDADSDHNHELNETEYLVFLSNFDALNVTNIRALPFLLQDNYKWISLGNDTINIGASSNLTSPLIGNEIRLNWICRRTNSALDFVSNFTQDVTLADFCDTVTNTSDHDTDGFLDDTEYIALIEMFSAGEWVGHNLTTIDSTFRKGFEKFKDNETNLLKIDESKSRGLCDDIADTINTTRRIETLVQLCKMALVKSDTDANGSVNRTEYVPFIDNLLLAYNFRNLSRSDFAGWLKSNETEIDISGLSPGSSAEKVKSLRQVCLTTGYAFGIIINTDMNITIYNSFLISNRVGITAGNLTAESDERRALQKAYTLFVEDEVQALSKIRLRRLQLQSDALLNTEIYQINDISCPEGSNSEDKCQNVSGSFSLAISNDEDPFAFTNLYLNKTQGAIDNGSLLAKLATIDPDSSINVLKSSAPFQPTNGEVDPTEPISSDKSSSDEAQTLSLFVIIGAAIGVSFMGAGLFVFLMKRKSSGLKESHIRQDTKTAPFVQSPEDLEEGNSTGLVFSVNSPDDDCTTNFSDVYNSLEQCPSQGYRSDFKVNDESVSESDIGSWSRTSISINQETQSSIGPCEKASQPTNETDENKTVVSYLSNDTSKETYFQQSSFQFDDSSCYVEEDERLPRSNSISIISSQDTVLESFDSTLHQAGAPTICRGESLEWSDIVREHKVTNAAQVESTAIPAASNNNLKAIGEVLEAQSEQDDLNVFTIADDDSDESVTVDSDREVEGKEDENEEESIDLDEESTRIAPIDNEAEDVIVVNSNGSDDESQSASELNDEEDDDEDEDKSASEIDESDSEEGSVPDDKINLELEVQGESESSYDEADTLMDSASSFDSAYILASYEKYRPIVEELVRKVVPDEVDNIDAMMEQFIGKEHELVATLQNMADNMDDDGSSKDPGGSEVTDRSSIAGEDSESCSSEEDDEEKPKIALTNTRMDTSDEEEESEDNDAESIASEEASASEEGASGDEDDSDDKEDEEDSDEEEEEDEDSDEEEDDETDNASVDIDVEREESEYSEETVEDVEVVEVSCTESDDEKSSEDDESSEYESD
jgi:hypothetical protein